MLLTLFAAASAFSMGEAGPRMAFSQRRTSPPRATVADMPTSTSVVPPPDEISADAPLHVLIAGAGVGGLILANCLEMSNAPVTYTILERTKVFKKFGGPIQLASNAMQGFRNIDAELYDEIEHKATWTGNRTNGIKDGIRDEWYAKFDLKTPAFDRSMPYTCVVDRPDLQDILLKRVGHNMRYGAGVVSYEESKGGHGGIVAELASGEKVTGDVLIGADGIWSKVRQTMFDAEDDRVGSAYSGYTVFAGELTYNKGSTPSDIGPDPACGYKVYIGPLQYFVITDIGNGRYQWYAFLARPEGSEATEPKPAGVAPYLSNLFTGWSPEVLDILEATREDEIEQRDLYDRPPVVLNQWTDGNVALLGDAIHAMMPNLGQGGCQALEDAVTISEEIEKLGKRSEVEGALQTYRNRRLARSAAVQGLSRFASDIIIRGFDTPCKIGFYDGKFLFENVNYAGVVTRLLQPILPLFFTVQFNFLYDGYKNEFSLEQVKQALGFLLFGGAVLAAFAITAGVEVATIGEGIASLLGVETLLGAEGAEVIREEVTQSGPELGVLDAIQNLVQGLF